MGTKISTTNKPVHSAEYGNSARFVDTVDVLTTDIALNSIVQLCKVPAGTAVDRVVVKNTDMDTNVAPAMQAKIGFAAVDGSAMPAGADAAVSADGVFGRAAATTTIEIFPPYKVEKDSWLTLVVTAAPATAANGTIQAKVEGELLGVK